MGENRADFTIAETMKEGAEQWLEQKPDNASLRRELSVSFNICGGMHQIAGDHHAAMQAFEQSLNIREVLATEINTPEARRDLMISFYKIASLNKSENDTAIALKFFQLALHQAKQYQSMPPCSHA